MKVEVKTLHGNDMTATDATEAVGATLRIAPGFVAIAVDEESGIQTTIEAHYEPDRGRYVITKLTNEAVAAEFLEDRLKYVATQAILQVAIPRCIALLLDDSPEARPTTVADLTSSEGRIIPVWMAQAVIKRGVKDERWEVIEILYGTAALAGLAPLKLIAQELEIPERTAAYWVQEARTAGWLAGLTSNLGRPSSDRPDAATPPSS
ncbi:hypothetical protein Q9R08_03670 [Microbacterium sp. QXD-8]|uniref:Uncharacterized protein n=1 Tax=Microbacterium psychrotolerans TaxID=3068321 RepID=A0ABU0YXL4_9MICO|nr:hypothetical protein [Microbacterium sp. QXD-8]MDQ7877067.1 hypothetical protein [Microbacterium sp. QXD-8]